MHQFYLHITLLYLSMGRGPSASSHLAVLQVETRWWDRSLLAIDAYEHRIELDLFWVLRLRFRK